YLGIVLDRASAAPVFMASAAGGMEIEEVAAKDPKAILKEYIDPAVGFQVFQARKLAFGLGLKPEQINQAVQFMTALYHAYGERGAGRERVPHPAERQECEGCSDQHFWRHLARRYSGQRSD